MKTITHFIVISFLFVCIVFNNACNSSYDELIKKGQTLRKKCEYNKALVVYDKAIKLNPNNGQAFYDMGLVYMEMKDTILTFSNFDRAKELKLNNENLFYELGLLFFNKKDTLKAIQCYTKSIELGNKKSSVFYERGQLFFNLRKYDLAIQDFTQAINQDKYELAITLDIVNEELRYIKEQRKVLEKFIKPFYYRAKTKEILNDYYGALLDYDMVIKLNPTYSEIYFKRGNLKFKLGDFKGACLDWSMANEYGYEEAIISIHENCNKNYN